MRRDGIPTRRPSRRAGGWAPDALGSSLVLWLDNSLITTSGGLVTAWPDLSRFKNHASQASPALQPAYEATGWNGTQPSVAFTAANDHVLEANGVAAGFSGDDKPYTITWVWQRTTGTETGERYVLGLGQAASALPAVRVGQTGGTLRSGLARDDAAVESLCSGADNRVTTREQVTMHFDGVTRSYFLNGVLVDTDATALGTVTFDRFFIGKWRTVAAYDIRMAGGTIYDRALTAPELALVWQWNRDHFTGLP